MTLAGKKVLAVGASTGAGAGVARWLSDQGAAVAYAARRRDKVEALAAAAGNGAIGLECDVCDDESCEQVVRQARERLDGLDAVLHAPAIIAMSTLMDADSAYWAEVLHTNVIGAAMITRAAVPALAPTHGRVVYYSSVSASGTPWPGLGLYMASKAAMERMVDTWRVEHPEVRFTCLSIGPIDSERDAEDLARVPTERAMKVVQELMPGWYDQKLARPPVPDREIAVQVGALLETDADIERVVIQAPAQSP